MAATTIRCYEKICDFHGDKVTVLVRYHCSLLPAFFLEGKASFQGKVWYNRDAAFSHSNSGTGTKEIKGSGLQIVIIKTELLTIITKQCLLQAKQQTWLHWWRLFPGLCTFSMYHFPSFSLWGGYPLLTLQMRKLRLRGFREPVKGSKLMSSWAKNGSWSCGCQTLEPMFIVSP